MLARYHVTGLVILLLLASLLLDTISSFELAVKVCSVLTHVRLKTTAVIIRITSCFLMPFHLQGPVVSRDTKLIKAEFLILLMVL